MFTGYLNLDLLWLTVVRLLHDEDETVRRTMANISSTLSLGRLHIQVGSSISLLLETVYIFLNHKLIFKIN